MLPRLTLFVYGLKLLSHPATARRGNLWAAGGMGLAMITTLLLHKAPDGSGIPLTNVWIILAAIGGVWVPVFVMPKFMQLISNLSPMNWGLNGFYDVFLRNASFMEILPEISLLFLFFIITTIISILYNEKKNAV